MKEKYSRSKYWVNYPGQFGLLLALFGGGTIVLTVLMGLYLIISGADISESSALFSINELSPKGLRIIQILGSVFQFGLPALLLALILRQKPAEFFYFNRKSSFKIILYVSLLAFFGLALSDLLSFINEQIPLSAAAYEAYKAKEVQYMEQVFKIADFSSVGYILLSLFILAVLPGFFEELLFRGALQPILIGWTKSAFWGIFITALLFSLLHISYFGFLPRLFLGMVLGYIFYYTKNLWMSVLYHFLNNAFAVASFYLYSRKGELDFEKATEHLPLYVSIGGSVLFCSIFYLFYKESVKEKTLAAG